MFPQVPSANYLYLFGSEFKVLCKLMNFFDLCHIEFENLTLQAVAIEMTLATSNISNLA